MASAACNVKCASADGHISRRLEAVACAHDREITAANIDITRCFVNVFRLHGIACAGYIKCSAVDIDIRRRNQSLIGGVDCYFTARYREVSDGRSVVISFNCIVARG